MSVRTLSAFTALVVRASAAITQAAASRNGRTFWIDEQIAYSYEWAVQHGRTKCSLEIRAPKMQPLYGEALHALRKIEQHVRTLHKAECTSAIGPDGGLLLRWEFDALPMDCEPAPSTHYYDPTFSEPKSEEFFQEPGHAW